MRKSDLIKAARASMKADLKRPAGERFDEMVKDGVIDAQGHVLLKSPITDGPNVTKRSNGVLSKRKLK